MTRVVAPSDVGTLKAARVRIGGRVLALDEGRVTLGDAFTAVEITLDSGAELAVGDLAVLDVKKQKGSLACVAILDHVRPARPPRLGEDDSESGRLMARGVGAALVARARAVEVVRGLFGSQGFLEVDTPVVVPSPGLDLHLDALAAGEGFLITSPEYQMKRLLVGGVPRLFQITHVFRQGELGERHNPEFSMLEWYRAFAGMDDVMADTEAVVTEVVRALSGGAAVTGAGGVRVNVRPPFERVTVAEAFERHAGLGGDAALALADADEERFYRLLVDQVEPALARSPRPVFLTDYPISQASLARRKPDDPRVCERFELYVAGVELCNGFGELTCPKEQRARLVRDQKARRAAKKPVYPIDERFLAALEEGMPPSAGNALGLDRLVAVALGEPEIAAVMPFPDGWL